MSVQIDVTCDACGKRMDESEDSYCDRCYHNSPTKNDDGEARAVDALRAMLLAEPDHLRFRQMIKDMNLSEAATIFARGICAAIEIFNEQGVLK